jgi:hypothetical protein
MDATRESIRDTVDELKGRVQETADWRNYVAARPNHQPAHRGGLRSGRRAHRGAGPPLRQIPLLLAPRIIKRTPPPGLAGHLGGPLSARPARHADRRPTIARFAGSSGRSDGGAAARRTGAEPPALLAPSRSEDLNLHGTRARAVPIP